MLGGVGGAVSNGRPYPDIKTRNNDTTTVFHCLGYAFERQIVEFPIFAQHSGSLFSILQRTGLVCSWNGDFNPWEEFFLEPNLPLDNLRSHGLNSLLPPFARLGREERERRKAPLVRLA
jgi:hypothetical protein